MNGNVLRDQSDSLRGPVIHAVEKLLELVQVYIISASSHIIMTTFIR